ncbi:MAG: hypothetical protein IJL87_09030 [Clostridia bacterium]|nr:hypothetical protein [Clostridia bacterium]
MKGKNWIIYLCVLAASFIITGVGFMLLVNNNVLSPASTGVQKVAGLYNSIGFKVSTPALTVEKLETARKSGDVDGIVKCCPPEVRRAVGTAANGIDTLFGIPYGEQLTNSLIAASILPYYDMRSDLHFLSLDTDDYGNVIAKIRVVQPDGSTDDTTIPMKKINGIWYINIGL